MSIDYREKTSDLIAELENKFIERDELIRLLVLAVLSKEHLFMIGKPGVAKSYLARIISEIVKDTRYFEYLINENVKYEEMFTQDANSVIQAEFVFLDEIYKVESNTAILNAFLQIMNERIFTKGFETHHLPLVTMIGASNELPSSGSLGAFDDRLIFRYEVVRIQERKNFLKFLKSDFDKTKDIKNSFTLDAIDQIQLEAENISVSDDIYNLLYEIDAGMTREQSEISNRKIGKAERILRVCAFLNGRDYVNKSDLFLLQHIAWQNHKERGRIMHLLPRAIYGSKSAVENRVIKIKEGLDLLFGRIRSRGGFLNYQEEIRGEEEAQEPLFQSLRNYLAAYKLGYETNDEHEAMPGLDDYIKELEELIKEHKNITEIEEDVKNNIFLVGFRSTVYAKETLLEIDKLLKQALDESEKIRVFIVSNRTYREYLNNIFKARSEQRKIA